MGINSNGLTVDIRGLSPHPRREGQFYFPSTHKPAETDKEMSGIFTQEQESLLGKKLDELIDFKNIKGFGMLEVLDGFVFTKCISFVDDKYGDLIPAEYKDEVGKLAIHIINEEWAECEEPICVILDTLVDIPLVEDEQEAWIIKAIVEAVFGILLTKVLHKTQPGE